MARPRGSPDPKSGPSPHSPPGAGPGTRGRGRWGLALGAAPGSARRRESGGPRPGWARRPAKYLAGVGAAGGCWWSLGGPRWSHLPLPRRGTRKCKGAGRRNLTQVPAPAPPPLRACPSKAPPPPSQSWGSSVSSSARGSLSVWAFLLSRPHRVLLSAPSVLSPTLRRGPILPRTLRPEDRSSCPHPQPHAPRPGGASWGSPDPGAHAWDSHQPAGPPLLVSLFLFLLAGVRTQPGSVPAAKPASLSPAGRRVGKSPGQMVCRCWSENSRAASTPFPVSSAFLAGLSRALPRPWQAP